MEGIKTLLLRTGILISIVVCAIALYVGVSPLIIEKGLLMKSTEKQILLQYEAVIKKDYDILILGNSRLYRGVNPELFPNRVFNYAYDNDSYNQIYYKMRMLEQKGKKPLCYILGIDFTIFGVFSDSRNYIYSKLLEDRYMKDYSDRIDIYKWVKEFYRHKIYLTFKPFLSGLKNLALGKIPTAEFVLTPDGQYRDYHIDTLNYVRNIRAFDILPLQKKYFEEILNACRRNKIKVIIVSLPISDKEKSMYQKDEMDKYHNFIMNYVSKDIHYLNYAGIMSANRNFSDYTHLTATASDEFSKKLSRDVSNLLNIKD